ncbi:MAG: protein kinase [Acidobacteriota bacterium]|nr:protein kinase [Acidobacteriota bacterium]MDH3783994.1 protein kinase [Acidobacteriota bacterium]
MSIVGNRIQHYRIIESLGAGGMGEVYIARDETLQRDVALKAIHPERQMHADARQRLLGEARALSKLEHPSICRIYDYVEDGAIHYLVLELIRGRPLNVVLRDDVADKTKLQWAAEIADALVAAHGAGIVHRDLKPSNVMIDTTGCARVLDFGLAHAVDPGVAVTDEPEPVAAKTPVDNDATVTSMGTPGQHTEGTPLYMSPEQARGEATGTPSDMFSFGLLLHEMFCGERAYPLTTHADFHRLVTTGDSARTNTDDGDLTKLIERLKTPAQSGRPTAIETFERLGWIRGKPARRLRRFVAAAVTLVVFVGGIKYTLDVRRERDKAEFHRGQADELIEFMIGDLREKLEAVGRLDVLSSVGDEALEYFAAIDTDALLPADRERYARTLSQLGSVQVAGGDLDGALSAYSESVRIYQSLVVTDPTNAPWKIKLGGAHFGVGSVHWERDELDPAREAFEEYLALATAVHQLDPTDPTNRLELGYALTNVAAVNEAVDRSDDAMNQLERAIEIKRSLVESDAANRDYAESLANTLTWLTFLQQDRGQLPQALALQNETLALRRRFVSPDDAQTRRSLSVTLGNVARINVWMGRMEAARDAYREDLQISRALHDLDPENGEWTRGLVIALQHYAEFVAEDSPEDRTRLLNDANALADRLVAAEPTNVTWISDRLATRRLLASAAFESGNAQAAQRWLAEHQDDEALEPGTPLATELALALVLRAKILDNANEVVGARAALERALALYDDDGSFASLRGSFWVLDALDRRDEARTCLTRLAQLGYAHRALTVLFEKYGVAAPSHEEAAARP